MSAFSLCKPCATQRGIFCSRVFFLFHKVGVHVLSGTLFSLNFLRGAQFLVCRFHILSQVQGDQAEHIFCFGTDGLSHTIPKLVPLAFRTGNGALLQFFHCMQTCRIHLGLLCPSIPNTLGLSSHGQMLSEEALTDERGLYIVKSIILAIRAGIVGSKKRLLGSRIRFRRFGRVLFGKFSFFDHYLQTGAIARSWS